jgi:hypothetical protein
LETTMATFGRYPSRSSIATPVVLRVADILA